MTDPRAVSRIVDAAGLTATLGYALLAVRSHADTHVPVGWLFYVLALAWAATLVTFLAGRMAGHRLPLGRVIAWALVFRAVGLAAEPILEDDHHRYLWDGYTFATSGSPYGTAPIDAFDHEHPPRIEAILSGINHPDVPTIYGPVAELAFLGAHHLAFGHLLPLKGILVLADLLALGILARLVPPHRLVLYAWCPLLVQEVAFSAHPEVLGVAFALAALLARRAGRVHLAGVGAALAVGARALAIPLVPFLLLGTGWRGWGTAGVTLAALYLPFHLGAGLADGPGLLAFGAGWEFNSTGYAILATLLGSTGARITAALLLGAAGVLLWRRERGAGRAIPRGDLLYAALFLLAPVVNPWYLLWMLPFVVAYPSRWGLAALAVVSLCYVHGLAVPSLGLPAYHHPGWVRPVEIGIVLTAALVDHLARRRADASSSGDAVPGVEVAPAEELREAA